MIIESTEILNKISNIGMELLKNMSHLVNKPVLRHIYKRLMGRHTYATVSKLLLLTNLQQEMVERGDDPILFHAPALMLFLTRKLEQMGQIEADLAAQTMALYAPTLGLGTCYAGIVMLAFSGVGASSKIKKIITLPKGYAVSNALIVGYAEHQYRNIPDRKNLNVYYL
jgi:nitroreductase